MWFVCGGNGELRNVQVWGSGRFGDVFDGRLSRWGLQVLPKYETVRIEADGRQSKDVNQIYIDVFTFV